MIILIFLFIVLPLIVVTATSGGLLAFFIRSAVSMQAKRLSKGQHVNEAAVQQRVRAYFALAYIVLLVTLLLFPLFLVVRYYMT